MKHAVTACFAFATVAVASVVTLVGCAEPIVAPIDDGADDDADDASFSGDELRAAFHVEGGYLVSPRTSVAKTDRVVVMTAVPPDGALPRIGARAAGGAAFSDVAWSFEEEGLLVGTMALDDETDAVELGVAEEDAPSIVQLAFHGALSHTDSDDDSDSDTGGLDAAGAASSEQALNGSLANLGVLPRSAWTSEASRCTATQASFYRVAIHHSATPSTQPEARLRQIESYERSIGYCDMAYHFAIAPDGRVFEGRPLPKLSGATAHNNEGSIGIVFIGNYHPPVNEVLSEAQVSSASSLLAALSGQYGIALDRSHVRGHREHPQNSTACPGDRVMDRIDEIVSRSHGAPATTSPPQPTANPNERVGMAARPQGDGYWVVTRKGAVIGKGAATSRGDLASTTLAQPIVAMAATPSGRGYWLAAADGGVFAFGDAPFKGSMGGTHLNQPIVGMATTPTGNGYWLVAADGGVFGFGDAPYKGSMGGTHLNKPVVGMASTSSGHGYWLVASDGGIFAFGDAPFKGSMGGTHLNKPVVGMERSAGGHGYWLVASDGGIFAFGDAPFQGSTGALHLVAPVRGMQRSGAGNGYWLLGADGGVFSFAAPFLGAAN